MRNKIFLALLLIALTPLTASAEMNLFVREDCTHCTNLHAELESYNAYSTFNINTYDISKSEDNMLLYLTTAKALNYQNGGVPLLVDGGQFVEGAGANH